MDSGIDYIYYNMDTSGCVMVKKLYKQTWKSEFIGCPIHSALCHLEAKSFVNYYICYIVNDIQWQAIPRGKE